MSIILSTPVEFALNLSPELKVKNGIQKYLLKEILYDYLDPDIMKRPKWGFSIPLERWLKKDLSFLVDKYLNEQAISKTNLFNYEYVLFLIKRFKANHNYIYNRLWNLIILQKFMLKNF